MAALGFGEGRRRGSRDNGDDHRRKRPFSSTLEEEEEEEGWGGGGGPSWYLDKDDRERPPARKARGRPWPDPHEEEEEGRTGGESWGSRWGESGKGSREPPRVRGRSRSPPRGGQGWRGRGSPSPPRERAWRSPPSLGQPDRASRTKGLSSSSGSCSSGRKAGRGSPGREEPKRRPWESPPKKITGRKSPQEEEGRQLPPSSRRAVERGHLERSSSSSTYRSKRDPEWEARQEYTQSQSHRERDHPYPEKAGRSGERQRNHKQRESYTVERDWDSPSRGRRQESPAWGSSEWEKDREASPSYSVQSQFDRDHRRRSWDSPEGDGKEQEIWSRDYDLEMHHSSSEDAEDRGRLTGFEDEWTLSKGQEVTESPQGDLSGPEGRPRIYMGSDKRVVAPLQWVPRDEVVDFWNQCQSIMTKNVREYFLSTCPRPTLPNRSSFTPILNPDIQALLTEEQVKAHEASFYHSHLVHTEVLNMLAPAMTIYEMAVESIREQVPVDSRELREWVRRVICFIGSITKRLQLQCCCSALEAINPQFKRMAPKMSAPTADGLLFAEDKAKLLKRIIQSFPELENKAEDRDVEHSRTAPRLKDERRKRGSGKIGTRPQDGAAQLQELRSAHPSYKAKSRRDNEATLELWHRRFAHRDPKLILEMQNRNLAVGMKVSESDTGSPASCAICLDIKASGTPSPPRTERRSAKVLDLIHIVLLEPFEASPVENRKYLLFVDDFSRYCVPYLLTEEKETEELMSTYLTWLRKIFRRQPKAFQMGDGAEGLSGDCRAFLEKEGIVLRRRNAESPEPSGSFRGEITSLLEMTRCMLADAELPEEFWGEALITAVYLLNRLPASSTGKTPFQLWYGRAPCLRHIRVFGSLAYTYVLQQGRRDPKSSTEQAIFLGYVPRNNWYKVMNLETGIIHKGIVASIVEDEKADQREVVIEASEHLPQEGGTTPDTDPGSNSVQEEEAGTLTEQQTLGEVLGGDAGGEPVPVDEALVPEKGPAIRSSPQPDHRSLAPGSNCPANSLPGSWEEVERMPASEGARWREAARKELEALHQREAWSLTELPAGQEARGCKWVFAVKPGPEGESYLARVVAEGFLPKGGEDPAEPFALAVQECTLRMLQGLATARQMQMRHLEVTAKVAGELYMEQPPGFANQEHPGWVYKLKKNLFGLKEASQAQNEKLKAVLLQEGFMQDHADPCLYSRSQNGHLSFILSCAEDLVVATQREQEYTEIVHQLSGQVDVRELGDATHYLTTQMKRDKLDLLKEEHKNI